MSFGAWWEWYTKDSITDVEVFRPAFFVCYTAGQADKQAEVDNLKAENKDLQARITELEDENIEARAGNRLLWDKVVELGGVREDKPNG